MVDQGAGRFGHRRRQIHAARDALTAFAEQWRPVHPDLPTDPTHLAQQVRWLHGHHIEQQINTYATRSVTAAHPEADTARHAEHTARAAFEAAQKARRRLDTTLYTELRPYGRIAHLPQPAERFTTVTDELTAVEHDMTTATTRIDHLQTQPTIRDLTDASLDTEHDQWAADRAAQRQTATRQTQERCSNNNPAAPGRPSPATPSSTADPASGADHSAAHRPAPGRPAWCRDQWCGEGAPTVQRGAAPTRPTQRHGPSPAAPYPMNGRTDESRWA